MEIEHTLVPDHAGRGAWAVLLAGKRERNAALGVIGIQSARTIGAIVMDDARAGLIDALCTRIDQDGRTLG